jgi:tRNA(His) guanylyltransferase
VSTLSRRVARKNCLYRGRFSEAHAFAKPNDERALRLMDSAAMHVMRELPDVVLAFGESDEYRRVLLAPRVSFFDPGPSSFLLTRSTTLFGRRHAKILSTVLSTFTSAYVFGWGAIFGDAVPLRYPPTFDARVVLYPEARHVRNYFAWRQTDSTSSFILTADEAHVGTAHINNLYNTVFWALVQQGGKTTAEAHAQLRVRLLSGLALHSTFLTLNVQGTVAAQKYELLFTEFGLNYNTIDVRLRKGSVIIRDVVCFSFFLTSPSRY